MSDRFDLYSIEGVSPGEAARMIAGLLQIEFTSRDSSYLGGEYFLYRGSDRLKISVESNFLDEEGEPSEPLVPLQAAIIRVNYATPDVVRRLGERDEVALIRSEVFE